MERDAKIHSFDNYIVYVHRNRKIQQFLLNNVNEKNNSNIYNFRSARSFVNADILWAPSA